MPRLPRVQPAEVPAHLVQRGNNRLPCFFADSDYASYLHWMQLAALRTRVAIHAYALMTNHVHILASPSTDGGLGRMMQQLGRNYAGTVNKKYGRTGSLWGARYRASLVDSEAYLLEVYRYIDLNPARAGLVERPEEYRWSSARAHLALEIEPKWLTDHPLFQSLGADRDSRGLAYRNLLEEAGHDESLRAIRSATARGEALGSNEFRERLEALDRGRVSHRRPGPRPRVKNDGEDAQDTLDL